MTITTRVIVSDRTSIGLHVSFTPIAITDEVAHSLICSPQKSKCIVLAVIVHNPYHIQYSGTTEL
jgi:hypothetical protein